MQRGANEGEGARVQSRKKTDECRFRRPHSLPSVAGFISGYHPSARPETPLRRSETPWSAR
jgi:hypothetical protein